MKVYMEIDSKRHEVESGLVSAKDIYALAQCENSKLFLNRVDDEDVPLSLTDYLIVQSEISLVSGQNSLENNPLLRKPVAIRFNGESGIALSKAKVTGRELKQHDSELPAGRLFADIANGPDAEIEDNISILTQDGDAFFVVPADENSRPGDPVDVEQCVKHHRHVPKRQQHYRIRVDGEKIKIDRKEHFSEDGKISGKQILQLVEKESTDWALNQKFKSGRRERIKPDEFIDIARPGVERFETVRRQAQQGSE